MIELTVARRFNDDGQRGEEKMNQFGGVRLMDAALEFGQQIKGQLELAQYLKVILFARAARPRAEQSHLAGGQLQCGRHLLIHRRGTLCEFPFGQLQLSAGRHRLLQF